MKLSRRFGRYPLAIALILLVGTALVGCSPIKPKTKPTPIPRADADDIVQIIGTTLSANNGGWYLVIKTLADSLSKTPPPSAVSTVPNQFPISFPTPPGFYNLNVAFLNGDSTISAFRDTSSSDLIANVTCTNGKFSSANGVDGDYWLSAPDSAFFVANLLAAAPDTLEFSGTFDDSCFALVHSTISTSAAPRLWFLSNFGSFTMRIPKPNLVSSPYPVGDISEMQWNIEAFGLRSAVHSDWGFDEIVEVHMVFDGTANAHLSLGDVLPDPSWVYYYKVNLDTGQITREN